MPDPIPMPAPAPVAAPTAATIPAPPGPAPAAVVVSPPPAGGMPIPGAIVQATAAPIGVPGAIVGTGSAVPILIDGKPAELWVPEFTPPRRSETITKLALALSRAQKKIIGAAKTAENPHFKSTYSPLIEHLNAARDPLGDEELAVVQPVAAYGRFVCITTILVHSSGEFIEQDLVMTAGNATPQNVVGAITYGRRAAYSAMVGTAPADDDDGNAASDTFPDGVKRDRGKRSDLQASGGKPQAPSPTPPNGPGGSPGPHMPPPSQDDPPSLERAPGKPNATPPGAPHTTGVAAAPIPVVAPAAVPAGSVPPPPGMKPPMRAPGA